MRLKRRKMFTRDWSSFAFLETNHYKRLFVEAVLKLPTRGSAKIGWVMCEHSEQVTLQRCFRCFRVGQSAKTRFKQYRKCGTEGNRNKDCRAHLCCTLCKWVENVDYRHIVGNNTCTDHKIALNENRGWNWYKSTSFSARCHGIYSRRPSVRNTPTWSY